MSHFTPLPALAGGALIGLSASLLYFTHGRIAGITSIVADVFRDEPGVKRFRVWFLLGLLVAGLAGALAAPHAFEEPARGYAGLAAAGLLVGFGTRISNGCTSGHGVCGISRFSARSFVATMVFMATGFLTVFASRLLTGAP